MNGAGEEGGSDIYMYIQAEIKCYTNIDLCRCNNNDSRKSLWVDRYRHTD